MDVGDELSEFEFLHPGPDQEDRDRALAAIREADAGWSIPHAPLQLDALAWRPDLTFGTRVLHLALDGEVPRALVRRMEAASRSGRQVTLAVGAQQVEPQTMLSLQAIDARVVAVDWRSRQKPRGYRSIADWVAGERIALAPSALRDLATARFDEALADRTSVKGRLFEETLCLMFSQVSWLTVEQHAYRNTTEEIDLLLSVNATGQLAELLKSPVAVATAKNEATPTGSATVKYLKGQISNRKDRSSFGFLCSATTISQDAKVEILRDSGEGERGKILICSIDGHDLRNLLSEAADLDGAIEKLIFRAVAS